MIFGATSDPAQPSVALIGVEPYPAESRASFLARMTEANGYDSPKWICDLFDAPQGSRGSWSAEQVDRLAEASAMDPAKLAPIFRIEPDASPGTNCGRRRSRRTQRNNGKVCPACLRQHGFHHRAFELADVEVCAMHGSRLLSACTICAGRLSLNGPSLFHCARCFGDLRDADTESAEPHEIATALLMASRPGHPEADRPASAAKTADALMGQASDEQAFALLEGLGRLAPGPMVPLQGLCARDAAQAERRRRIAAGGRIVTQWPEAFFEALEAIGTREAGSKQHAIGLRTAFLDAFHLLHDRCPSPALTRAFVEFLSTRWSCVLGRGRPRRSRRHRIAPSPTPQLPF